MIIPPSVRKLLLVALALVGAGVFASACADATGVSESTVKHRAAGEARSFRLGPGTEEQGCDDWTCEPDPCFYNSFDPSCGGDPCTMYPSDPSCGGDPCEINPASCDGGGGGGETTAVPAGVPADYFSSLNEKEKEMCWASPSDCYSVYQAAKTASSWAAQQTSVGAHNGPQDALRHAMWNAQMTKDMDAARAEAWATAHEFSSTNADETRMDQHNNAAGRWAAANYGDAAQGVLAARDQGRLCQNVGSC